MSVKKSKAIELPEVNFSEHGDSRYLHLGTPVALTTQRALM